MQKSASNNRDSKKPLQGCLQAIFLTYLEDKSKRVIARFSSS